MQPQRVMRHLNVNPHFKTHADNIAQIIACADCIAEADLRVGYYMMVVGVNHDKVPVEEAPPRREFKMENLRVSMPAADFSRIMDAPPHVPVDIPQPGEALDGKIEDVKVYPVALDPAAVAAVFAGDLPGVPALPQAATPREMQPGYDF